VVRCTCSRRRPAPCSAPASRPSRMAPDPLAATGPAPHEHGRSPVLAHRRRCGARLPPSPFLLSSPIPPLLFPRGGEHRKGENPKRVGEMPAGDGLGHRVYALGQGGARAKTWRRALVGWRGGVPDVVSQLWMVLTEKTHIQL
jgi:hypothetical protein